MVGHGGMGRERAGSLAVKTALVEREEGTATYSIGTTLRALHMQNGKGQTDETITGQKNRGGKRDEELK